MEDRFIKYTKLYILIFFAFLAIPVAFGIVFGALYGFSKLVSSRPVDMIFAMGVITMPVAIFSTAYVIFFRRTKKHPSTIVRGISYVLFVLALLGCGYTLVKGFIDFFERGGGYNITDYFSFSLLFLAGNIALLFLVALLQAFTTEKEKDWMERGNVS